MELISIIIPYYKKKRYIELSINSALEQTYKNFEIIIIYDDESKEDLNLLKNIIKKDKRIKLVINKKNLGAGNSRNKGLKLSKGKFIAFLDADDLWLKDKLQKQLFFMNKKMINISHTSYHIINNKNKIIGKRIARDMNYNLLLNSCDIGLSTVMLRKNIITSKIKFANIKTKEDYVFWLKIASKNNIIFALRNNLTKWRRLDDSLSSSKLQKIYDGYLVYKKFMKFNLLRSIIYLVLLSFNYVLKEFRNR